MGFFKGLKEMSDWREKRKQKKEARKKEVHCSVVMIISLKKPDMTFIYLDI